MEMTTLGLFVLLLLAWIATLQISEYRKLVLDKYRFRYFAIRDDLAMLVASGKLDESSWEYELIVDAINHQIRTIDSVTPEQQLSFIMAEMSLPEEQRTISRMEKKIANEDVKPILLDYFIVTRDLLSRSATRSVWRLGKKGISPLRLILRTIERKYPYEFGRDIEEVRLSTGSLLEHLNRSIESFQSYSPKRTSADNLI